jgi:hypothetical protein
MTLDGTSAKNRRVPSRFPPPVARLFWDVDPSTVDLVLNRDYILERVMSRGGREAMRWLRETYAQDVLASFVERKGASKLAPRELAYWSLISGATLPTVPTATRPRWMGP